MFELAAEDLSAVSETLLIPLYIRAKESRRSDAMLMDDLALATVNQLNYKFTQIKLPAHDELAIILRLCEFDHIARDFLVANPDGVVVHIGCGLDTRFERVDNGHVEWNDLDLPNVIDLRRKLIGGQVERYHLLSISVFDPDWYELVSQQNPRPFIFLAEGVFPYFEEKQVRSLVCTLQNEFPGSELVFDAHTPFVILADNLQLKFSKVEARLQFALKHGRDVEPWNPGICLLEEWFYFKGDEPRVRPYRWMSRVPLIAKSTGILLHHLSFLYACPQFVPCTLSPRNARLCLINSRLKEKLLPRFLRGEGALKFPQKDFSKTKRDSIYAIPFCFRYCSRFRSQRRSLLAGLYLPAQLRTLRVGLLPGCGNRHYQRGR